MASDEVSTGLGREEAPRKGFQRIKPEVTISLLADVVVNAGSGWRPLILDDAGHNYSLPNGRLLLTEDASRVETLRNFTPKAASALLQKSGSQSEQSSNKQPVMKSLPAVEPSSAPKARDSNPASSPSDESASATTWSFIAVLMVAAPGLLWLLFKRRP